MEPPNEDSNTSTGSSFSKTTEVYFKIGKIEFKASLPLRHSVIIAYILIIIKIITLLTIVIGIMFFKPLAYSVLFAAILQNLVAKGQ